MSNRLPRALLADIAAVIGSGDHASALMMLGDESGPEASAAVSSYPKSRSKRSRYSSENDVLIEKSVKYTDFFLLSIVYV